MPGYKAHMVAGALAGAGGAVLAARHDLVASDPVGLTFLAGASLLGALAPDIDTDSRGQNVYYLVMVLADLVLLGLGLYKAAAILGFFAMLPALGAHRSWTHTWWAMLLLPAPIVALPWMFLTIPANQTLPYYAAAVVGYFSHLTLDRKFF